MALCFVVLMFLACGCLVEGGWLQRVRDEINRSAHKVQKEFHRTYDRVEEEFHRSTGKVKAELSDVTESCTKEIKKAFNPKNWLPKHTFLGKVIHGVTDLAKVIVDNTINAVVLIPIPGPDCGPADAEAVAWFIPDYIQFGTTTVALAGACRVHDDCYLNCKGKGQCDDKFKSDIIAECRNKLSPGVARAECEQFVAEVYKAAVDGAGGFAYNC